MKLRLSTSHPPLARGFRLDDTTLSGEAAVDIHCAALRIAA
jgi:hypothetical protein